MTMFLIQCYIFFYIFTRFRFAHATAETEGEEFSYWFAMFPILIELIAISIVIINLYNYIFGKVSAGDDEES
jgi:hypothetical protein